MRRVVAGRRLDVRVLARVERGRAIPLGLRGVAGGVGFDRRVAVAERLHADLLRPT